MASVQHHEYEDGKLVVRWGDNGREHAFAVDDDPEMRKAWRAAVAEGLVAGDFIEDEVDRSVAREMQGEVGIRKDASGGLIVAWWPNPVVAGAIASLYEGAGALAASDIHLTILYLAADGWATGEPEDDAWDTQLVAALLKILSRRHAPLEAVIGGTGRFVGPEDEDVVIALVDSPGIADFRSYIKEELICNGALPRSSEVFNQQHGFVPHITLAYVPKGSWNTTPLGEAIPISIDNVTLASGPTRMTFELHA